VARGGRYQELYRTQFDEPADPAGRPEAGLVPGEPALV